MDLPSHYSVALDQLQPVVCDLLARYGNDWSAVGTLTLAFDEALRRAIAGAGLAPYHVREESEAC